ncbi:MAG: Glucose-1-phosphate thymidylyltransferase [Chloroflexi bacterium ADurb.Bin180]|nr:MAG: Glucose-1-phosphate thymidylyltransferase [Chloroflexi bacterium ADurb.Bin180]
MTQKLTGVILAAGKGSRIQPLNLYLPKPLLPVCNKPIIQYQLEDMQRIGVRDVIIVVGHLKEEIISYFGDGSALGLKIRYVEQQQTLGIAHAVAQLESQVNTPFILFLGDIFLVPKDLQIMERMFWERRAGAVLAVKKEPNPEYIRRNFAVILHASGTVTRVIEKPRYLANNLKGCGVYIFDLSIFDAIRRTPRTAQRDEYEITNSIQILIDDGFPVYPADVIEWDMNITFACDLLECNRSQLGRLGKTQLVGEHAVLHPGVKLHGSVLGDRVVVDQPVEIKDSLVLPGTHISGTQPIEGMVLTPELSIDCKSAQKEPDHAL